MTPFRDEEACDHVVLPHCRNKILQRGLTLDVAMVTASPQQYFLP